MLIQRLVGVHEKRGERKTAGVVSGTKMLKKRSFSCRLKLTLAVQNRAVYYCRLEQCYRKDKKGWETE